MKSALLALLLAVPAKAGDFSSAAIGTTAADFLQLGVGGRAMGMGGAYSAVADDATAMYWNPAAMTQVPDISVSFMHSAYIASTYFDYAAAVKNFGDYGAVGVGLQYFSAGSIEETDSSFDNLGNFNPYDLALSLGYAYQLPDGASPLQGFSFGVDGKFIQSKILATAETEALDVGILSPLYHGVRLAFVVQNMGKSLEYEEVPEQLPLTLKLGSEFNITDRWIASADIAAPRNDNPYMDVGTEYWLVKDDPWKFAIRGGYSSQTLQDITGFTGASVGIGINYKSMAFDYAFVPYGGLGQAQRISLTFNFGHSSSDKDPYSSKPDPSRRYGDNDNMQMSTAMFPQ